ncbi:hypothetical protein AJ886_06975 [Campylobacter sp. BCW_6465]|nr:hypothetical protein AJ886_07035 [Campylobacter sp. BCW_6465]OEW44083.1 hypothetical protein AJ886_06975 [Campylobacter sp. BCW_6465]
MQLYYNLTTKKSLFKILFYRVFNINLIFIVEKNILKSVIKKIKYQYLGLIMLKPLFLGSFAFFEKNVKS